MDMEREDDAVFLGCSAAIIAFVILFIVYIGIVYLMEPYTYIGVIDLSAPGLCCPFLLFASSCFIGLIVFFAAGRSRGDTNP